MPNFVENSFDQLHRGWESMYGRGYRQPAPVTHNPEMGQPLGAGEGDPYLPVYDPARIGSTPLISPTKITASSAPPTLPDFNPTAPTAKKDSSSGSSGSSDGTQELQNFVHQLFHPATGGAPYVAGGVVGPQGSFTGGGIASAAPDLGIGAPLGADRSPFPATSSPNGLETIQAVQRAARAIDDASIYGNTGEQARLSEDSGTLPYFFRPPRDPTMGAPLGSDEVAFHHANYEAAKKELARQEAIQHALRLQPTPMSHDPAVGGFGGGGGGGGAGAGGMGGIQDAIKGLVGSFYSDVPSFKFDNPQTGQPQPAYFQPPGLAPNTGGVLPYTT